MAQYYIALVGDDALGVPMVYFFFTGRRGADPYILNYETNFYRSR